MTDITNSVMDSEKKPYVKPEFEVIELDNQTPLLASSREQSGNVGTNALNFFGEW